MKKLGNNLRKKFAEESIIWMATIRSDGRPHLVPIWFVTDGEYVYIRTMSKSVKYRNLLENPAVSVSMQDGSKPIIGEGKMTAHFPPGDREDIDRLFDDKYDWTDYDSAYDVICEFRMDKWIAFNH